MGQGGSKYFLPHLWRDDEPDTFTPIKYHPQFGFDGKREKRQIPLSMEEMDSASMESEARNHCASIQLEYRSCIRSNRPWWFRCKGLDHELHDCFVQELVHDMKEFEREKRLNRRERRINKNND